MGLAFARPAFGGRVMLVWRMDVQEVVWLFAPPSVRTNIVKISLFVVI